MTTAPSKMKRFVTTVNACEPLIIATKSSILEAAGVPYPPL